MAVTHVWESGVLVLTLKGAYTFEEVMAPIRAAIAAKGEEPFCLLTDLTRSESILQRPTREVVQESREVAILHRHIRRSALVVASTAAYGVARMGGTYASLGGLTASVFWTRDEALAWLLESPAVELSERVG